jgi:hypothetical protein
MKRDCQKTPGFWLPQGHQGVPAHGDYVKVEFDDQATGIGERLWVPSSHDL